MDGQETCSGGRGVQKGSITIVIDQDVAARRFIQPVFLKQCVALDPVGRLEQQTDAKRLPITAIEQLIGAQASGVAIALFALESDADGHRIVKEGQVGRGGNLAVGQITHCCLDIAAQLVIGPPRCKKHGAARGAATKQRALRTFQHLHRFKVEERRTSHGAERRFGEIDHHAGVGAEARTLTANEVLRRIARSAGAANIQAGSIRDKIVGRANGLLAQFLRSESGNRHRHILQRLFAFARRDDDRVIRIAAC